MKGRIFRLLERAEVDRIVQELGRRAFVDGRVSAKSLPEGVKNNLQVERVGPEAIDIDELVMSVFTRNRDLQVFAVPARIVVPIYSRYEPGMKYDDHVDSAFMGDTGRIRTDLAVTIFLSPPTSYDGGELVIEGEDEIKLDCGEAYVYPATTIHHVAPVTRGVRLAVVTWLQSAVRDETMRSILFDTAIAAKQAEEIGNWQHQLQMTKIYNNLLRYAAEPR
jgi:PKHD-type hydroxylase